MSGEAIKRMARGVIPAGVSDPTAAAAMATNLIGPRFGRVVLAPLNAAGEWARFAAVAAACASAGYPLHLAGGTWSCDTKQSLPSNLELHFHPTTRIVQSLVYSGGTDPFNCAFGANAVPTATTTTVNTNVVLGSRTIIADASIAVGTIIRVSWAASTLRSMYYTVTANAGGGGPTYTLTVDRPILEAFLANDTITTITSVPKNIHIYGHGASISGTGDRYVEFAAAQNCTVNDLRFDSVGGALGAAGGFGSFDLGCYNCHFHRCGGDGGGSTIAFALLLESSEHCTISEADAHNLAGASSIGIGLWDCWDCAVEESHATGVAYGVYLGSNGLSRGCLDCRIVGGSFDSNTDTGISINGPSYRTKCVGVNAHYNTVKGIAINVANTTDTEINGASCNGNAYGIYIGGTTVGTTGQNWSLRDNTTRDLYLGAACKAARVICAGAAPTSVELVGAIDCTVDELDCNNTYTVAATNVVLLGTGAVLRSAHLKARSTKAGTSLVMLNAGSCGCVLRDPDLTQAGMTGVAAYGPSTGKIYGDATPSWWSADANAHINWGTVVANGAAAVSVAYRWLRTNDEVILEMTTPAGTPTPRLPTIAKTAGTGFTLTGDALDTSTYTWKIV